MAAQVKERRCRLALDLRSASSCLDASLSWLRSPPSSLRRLAFSARDTLLLDTCSPEK